MKFQGFIGAAYQLDSVNVDNQRCVNLYPEAIESGLGKGGQVAYLRGTPGLEKILEVGDGPIRCVHVDSIGRVFVVSGNQIYRLISRADWSLNVNPVSYAEIDDISQDPGGDLEPSTEEFISNDHGYYTGLKVQVSSTINLPTNFSIDTDYWVIVTSANRFQLAASLADAMAGSPVLLVDRGSGVLTVSPQIPADVDDIQSDKIDTSADSLTRIDHELYTGLKVQLTTTGGMPSGLDLITDYFVIRLDDQTFQLADSLSNSIAGTEVDIMSVDIDDYDAILIGTNGELGGPPFILSSAEGPVKAASMSFGGEGVDSSTVFVDGVNNYLFKDDSGVTSLGVLGEIDVAQAIFNIDDDITLYSTTDVEDLVATGSIKVTTVASDFGTPDAIPAGHSYIHLYTLTDGQYVLLVRSGSIGSLTTAELVTFLSNGYVPGKTITFNDFSQFGVLPSGLTPVERSRFVFSGGGTEDIISAFAPPQTVSFTSSTRSGLDFGSVPDATDIKWSDGFFILAEGGTNRFRVSDVQSFNVDTLSFASAEGSPDLILALEVLHRDLYIFNEKTTEVYANTGNADFPFERIGGGFIEVGCAAAGSVAKVGGSICFLGRSEFGEGIVYLLQGLTPKRISTHAIEQAIRGYAAPSTAEAYSYETAGHAFYVLNFDEATWVYDLATGLWHERAYTNAGTLERHRAQYCAYIPSQRVHLVADYETNELYLMKEDVYSDDGDAITRLRSTPHVSAGRNRVFCSSFMLDMETGIGLDGGVQGSSPTVMLDWSNDGGHTWSSEAFALADAGSGSIGDYQKRVIWNRLGSFRQRVFRVKITDPVKVRLIDAHIELEAGDS